jgi:ubiquinone/menaquinone biosynthesis C-methylase UbiE
MMSESTRTYLTAAGYDWSLPLYDPIVKLLGGDKARMVLLDQAALRPGYRVLDIGCGTGTLATLIKHFYPEVEVVGLDPDPKALARARRKAAEAAVSIQFDQGFGDELPYAAASFDRVFSSFMFHHLRPTKRAKRFGQCGGSSSLAVRFRCSTSKAKRAARTVFSLIYFTQANA